MSVPPMSAPLKISGMISINRTSSSDGIAAVRISLTDADAGVEFVLGMMPLADFAAAVTGHGNIPVALELRGLDVLGKRAEHKSQTLKFEGQRYPNGKRNEAAALDAVAPYEVDGWVGDWQAFFNDHNRALGDENYRVGFHRWVPK